MNNFAKAKGKLLMKSILKSALCLILAAVMLLPVLSSCAAGLGWKYTREDMSAFEEFKGKIKVANEEKTAFLLTVTSEEGFNEIKASKLTRRYFR